MNLSTRRTSKDPLVKALLTSHKFNLLSVPRENANVYDLYLGKGRQILPPGRLQTILPENVTLPEPTRGEEFKAPEKTFSQSLELDIITKLTSKLFMAQGSTLVEGKLEAALKSAGASSAQIRFYDVVRDYVDPIKVHQILCQHNISASNAALLSDRNIYLVIGVVRAKGIEIQASTDQKTTARVDLQTDEISQGGGISLEKKAAGSLVFSGPKHIAFGVELVELHLGKAPANSLRIGDLPPAIDIRERPKASSVFVGNEKSSIFVDLPIPQ